MSPLTVAFYALLAMGVVAVIVAVVQRQHRAVLLTFAAVAFAVVGVLGILTIGVLFLIAAVVCAAAAVKSRASWTNLKQDLGPR